MSEINVNTIDKATGSTLNVGAAGTTVNIAGTAGTGFPASGAALTGSTDNTLVTVTGANAIQGEANLTYDGTTLLLSQASPILKVLPTTNGNDGVIELCGRSTDGSPTENRTQIKGEAEGSTANTKMTFFTESSGGVLEKMVIKSDGNVGIGETDPLGKLHVKTGDSGGTAHVGSDELVVEGSGDSGMTILSATNGDAFIRFGDSGDNQIGRVGYNHSSNELSFWNNGASRLVFIASGEARFNGGTGRASTLQAVDGMGSGYEALSTKTVNSGNATQIAFRNPNGTVGYINTNGSATSYLTSSDYRLKDNVTDLTGAITRIKTLKPKRFNFKSTPDETVDGFLAHEVSSIVPEAISGEKDALEKYRNADETPEGSSIGDNKLDENGDTIIDPQSIDQAKLVPLLVASVQELIAENETLKTRIKTLENA